MRPAPDLLLPRQRRVPWVVLGASIAVHVVVIVWLVRLVSVPTVPVLPEAVRIAELPPVPAAPRVGAPAARRPEGSAARRIEMPPATPPVATALDSGAGPGASPGGVSTPAGGFVRIGPAEASGKLWVAPLPDTPRELAARVARTHAELADSAVKSIIQAFLDSLALDPAARAARPPDWTTTIAGSKFGLDSKWIYVAGLKIPTAVLALLPLPHGNDQKAFDRSDVLYRDLRAAAQRSENMAEFKQAIREIRERKEAEREFEKNQRTPPPDITPEDPPK